MNFFFSFPGGNVSKVYYTSCPLNVNCPHHEASLLVDDIIKQLNATTNFLKDVCYDAALAANIPRSKIVLGKHQKIFFLV